LAAGKGLAGCWRKDEAHDPERFAAAVTAVFTMYAPDVVQYVCDPRTGLPRTHKWPPAISEVHDACSDRIADKERVKRYENWGRSEEDENERLRSLGRLPALPAPPRPTLQELHQKYGKDWGLGDNNIRSTVNVAPKPAPSPEEVLEHYKKYGLEYRPKGAVAVPASGRIDPAMAAASAEQIFVDGVAVDMGADF
jgi:hypothetical protein